MGFASIGIGIVDFLRFWNRAYWLPFIIMKFIFGWSAGYTHILHMLQHNNFSPSNTEIIVYWDFLFPLVMIGLYLLHQGEWKTMQKASQILNIHSITHRTQSTSTKVLEFTNR